MGMILSLRMTTQVVALESCKDVQFVFARGSGTGFGASEEWVSFERAIRLQMAEVGVSYGVREVEYEAIEADFFVSIGALVSGGKAYRFGKSVAEGVSDVVNFYDKTLAKCGNTKFVLAGYSQGARVVMEALSKINSNNVIYVATFGDPNLYLPEGEAVNPPACRGENLSSYRAYAPNCHTFSGILGARVPYEDSRYMGKIDLWCENEDLVCGSSSNLLVFSGHMKYASNGNIEDAVRRAVLKIREEVLRENVDSTIGKQAAMDTAILIDSSGSMGSYINRYRAEALRLAEKTFMTGGRVSLYEYRDLSDPFDVRQLCGFDCSMSEFAEKLNAIKVSGGGDFDESVLSATLGVMNTLSWRKGATKSIVVLTDAGYHSPDRDGTTIGQVVRRSLEIDPVNIYVITEDSLRHEYRELTESTGGKVFELNEMGVATDFVISRPVASLPFENYYGEVGKRFVFDASASYGVGGEIESYDWDLNGDGEFEITGAGAVVEKIFDEETESFVVVRVNAADGGTSTMSAFVRVGRDNLEREISALSGVSVERASDTEVILSWAVREDLKYVIVVMNDVILGHTLIENGEMRITDLDFSNVINFAVAGVDEGFNVGRFISITIPTDESNAAGGQILSIVQNDFDLAVENAGLDGEGAVTEEYDGVLGFGKVKTPVAFWPLWLIGTGVLLLFFGLRRKRKANYFLLER